MSKLGVTLPNGLDRRLRRFIPWGSKGAIIIELLYQLAERAEKDGGKCVHDLMSDVARRAVVSIQHTPKD